MRILPTITALALSLPLIVLGAAVATGAQP